ncbi:hypothetical protein PoB_001080400 [Plakobranchus ocellatus]|uniref:Uncharacterized protein n=1 Tax=Plakobranchus ocellatus TaxID=259542 RepID=A0AAV3YMR3_9GAST|nr:hypothetical protein PoB_001080400 [Plakobranchus ocellatus]
MSLKLSSKHQKSNWRSPGSPLRSPVVSTVYEGSFLKKQHNAAVCTVFSLSNLRLREGNAERRCSLAGINAFTTPLL